MRVKVTVNIDSEVYKRSHELGVNVSQACTNYLKLLNRQIDATLTENKGFLNPCSFTKENGAGGEGFEPSTPNLGDWKAEDWNRFRAWLTAKNYRGGYDSTLYNYAVQFSDCLAKRDLSKVRDLPDSLRPNILKALAALAKFSGCYEDWKGLVKSYGLRWTGRSADDVFIDRLNNVQDSEEIWNWVKIVKQARPGLSMFLDLMAVSGLRFVEAVNSFNLVIALTCEGKLDSYYASDKCALEHWRFKETFIRNTKKAFVSFVPEQIIAEIGRSEALPSADVIQKFLKKSKLPRRFGDIREAHGTFMTKFLKPSEIDFLHGRVTSSVFMANYFNPSLIGDLKARAFQGIAEIQEKVKV